MEAGRDLPSGEAVELCLVFGTGRDAWLLLCREGYALQHGAWELGRGLCFIETEAGSRLRWKAQWLSHKCLWSSLELVAQWQVSK